VRMSDVSPMLVPCGNGTDRRGGAGRFQQLRPLLRFGAEATRTARALVRGTASLRPGSGSSRETGRGGRWRVLKGRGPPPYPTVPESLADARPAGFQPSGYFWLPFQG
jgi:hypothetical protein